MATEGNAQETVQKPDAQANEQPEAKKPAEGKKEFSSDEAAALLKENMAYKKKLKAIEDAKAKEEEEAARQKGEYQKLHEMAQTKLEAMNKRLLSAEIRSIAAQEGITDPDFCMLINTSGVTVSDDGEIVGAKEAVLALKAAKPSLFTTPKVPGTPAPGATAPATGYKTWDEYSKAPESDRIEWARKHPAAFKALAAKATGQK